MYTLSPLQKRSRQSLDSFQSVRERGQALLILLLVLAVSLTVVLSTASRSVTDIQTSGLEEDSLRAFNAAEVGIEEALIQQTAPEDEDLSNDTSYTVDYTVASPDGNQYLAPSKYYSGDTASLWYVSQDNNGNFLCGSEPCVRGNNMRVCWGNTGSSPSPDQRPAIEVSIFYDDTFQSIGSPNNYSGVKVAREVFDPYQARANSNGFSTYGSGLTNNCALSSGSLTKQYLYRADVNYQSVGIPNNCRNTRGCLLMARVKFLYNETVDHSIGFWVQTTGGPNSLPPQGAEIESTGVAGDSTRKINVYQSYPEIPLLFDSSIFSMNGSLSK